MVMLGAGAALTATACGGINGSMAGAASALASRTAGGAPQDLLAGIDTIVVLMMENRSFDHYLGLLKHDPQYPGPQTVECLHGDESNPDPDGNPVPSYALTSRTQADPPHSWKASHAQWNNGRNDGFVIQHKGSTQQEVMGYYTRDALPFTYWLADNFTLCDHWYASVLGPTWPNRAVLHAADAAGLKMNVPFVGGPTTIWEVLPKVGQTGKNYHAGSAGIFSGLFASKVLAGVNPMAPLDDFFTAAKSGTLPPFVMIDPDYETNDDHPSHDVRFGQAMIASIYNALAASPQWPRCLFILTYDEHGGFFDHVPPPTCGDANPEYRQLGFRVPAMVIGPTVRRGAVVSQTFEHASVAATLRTKFGMPVLSPRMASSNDLTACIDPDAVGAPRRPPGNPPVITLPSLDAVLGGPVVHGQPELAAMAATGQIPNQVIDGRSRNERVLAWLEQAHALGAVRFE
jgi:phospholipase C